VSQIYLFVLLPAALELFVFFRVQALEIADLRPEIVLLSRETFFPLQVEVGQSLLVRVLRYLNATQTTDSPINASAMIVLNATRKAKREDFKRCPTGALQPGLWNRSQTISDGPSRAGA